MTGIIFFSLAWLTVKKHWLEKRFAGSFFETLDYTWTLRKILLQVSNISILFHLATFKIIQTLMTCACLSCVPSWIVFLVGFKTQKKPIFNVLTLTYFVTGKFNAFIHENKLKDAWEQIKRWNRKQVKVFKKPYLITVFPPISPGPQISATPLISIAPLNAALIRIVTIFY